jgi:hypothetical protein
MGVYGRAEICNTFYYLSLILYYVTLLNVCFHNSLKVHIKYIISINDKPYFISDSGR